MLELNKIYQGDCLIKLKELEDNSVDSIVSDPPYELGFMGKSWDNTGIANNKEMWKECLRVLKPGAYLLSFGGTRTYHRMASAIEDAGFEIRDMIEWVYGSGFPKSLNIGKAVDKLQGNKREVIGVSTNEKDFRDVGKKVKEIEGIDKLSFGLIENAERKDLELTKGTSEWEGWGTALKPAHEPIVMARKPLAEKTVAENCLKYGTGGINIDESRIETTDNLNGGGYSKGEYDTEGKVLELGLKRLEGKYQQPLGRFPANLIHDNSEEVRECFPETGASKRCLMKGGKQDTVAYGDYGEIETIRGHDDNGGNASRFFKSIIYQAKASKSERNKGCEEFETKQSVGGGGGIGNYLNDVNSASGKFGSEKAPAKNNHPTVKPLKLMEYLIKMVTPKGGIVLDPFAGSGTTLVASKKLGYKYIGIELSEEYCKIANERLTKLNDGIPPKPKGKGILPTII